MNGTRVGAQLPERRREDRDRADPVAVVVPEDDDASAAGGRRREELHRRGQAAHPERVVEAVRRGREVRPCRLDVREAAGREDARRGGRKAQLARDPGSRFRVLRPQAAADEARGADPRAHAPSQAPIARNFA